MGRGAVPPRCYREPSSGEVSNCTCIICRWTPVGFLAGGSRAGRWDPCGGRFRTGVSPCWTESATADWPVWSCWKCSSSVAGRGSPLAGVVNSVGPFGPREMQSPYAEETHKPLEHAVLIQYIKRRSSALTVIWMNEFIYFRHICSCTYNIIKYMSFSIQPITGLISDRSL